ncbi:MAG: cupin domain-containing protein [Gemmatimonadota bacterium]
MERYWKPEDMESRELCAGVTAKVAWGDKLMFSLVTLAPGAIVPEHAHPHEQMGMLLSGAMTLVVSGAPRPLAPREMYLVPGGVRHSATAGPGGAVALDAFAPPREEYK